MSEKFKGHEVRESGPRRPTQSEALAGVAFLMAHCAMITEVVRTSGMRGRELAAGMILANGIFALVFRVVWRIRIVPLLAIFTTTAMTEALVWRTAWEGQRKDELVYFGLGCAVVLTTYFFLVQRISRDRKS